MDILKLISQNIGYISCIVTFIVSTYKIISSFKKEVNYNTLMTLRLVIINTNMPLSERIEAGRMYVEKGGNGAVKKLVQELEEQELKNEIGGMKNE